MTQLLVLGATLAAGWVVVEWMSRRRTATAAPGVTIFSAPGCRSCVDVSRALRDAGIDAAVHDVTEEGSAGVRSVPTVVIADRRGAVRIRRSGQAAVRDLPELIDAALDVS